MKWVGHDGGAGAGGRDRRRVMRRAFDEPAAARSRPPAARARAWRAWRRSACPCRRRLRRAGRRPGRDARGVRRRRASCARAARRAARRRARRRGQRDGARPGARRAAGADGLEAALAEAYAGARRGVPAWPSAPAPSPRTPRRRATPASRTRSSTCKGADRVAQRVRDCWASFFGERALFYRSARAASTTCAWPSSCSGWSSRTSPACCSRRPRQPAQGPDGGGGRARARRGRGAGRGDARPLRPRPRRAAEGSRSWPSSPTPSCAAPDGGTEERPLDAEEGGRQTLTEDDLRRLAELGRTAGGAPRRPAGRRVGDRRRRALPARSPGR